MLINGYRVSELGLRGMLRHARFVYVATFPDWSHVRLHIKLDTSKRQAHIHKKNKRVFFSKSDQNKASNVY